MKRRLSAGRGMMLATGLMVSATFTATDVFAADAAAVVERGGPRARPANWAAPVIDCSLENAFQVSDELFRCEQPEMKDVADLKKLGAKTILNLRRHHTDSTKLELAGFLLLVERMDAGKITVDQLVAALRQFRGSPKPVIVHCWHGSDRTGTFVAAYRIVFQNWTREAALDEFVHGGFGYHERWYPNLKELLGTMDEAELRRRVLAP